jgi:hypothetical protein
MVGQLLSASVCQRQPSMASAVSEQQQLGRGERRAMMHCAFATSAIAIARFAAEEGVDVITRARSTAAEGSLPNTPMAPTKF